MRRFLFLALFLPSLVVAQDGEQYLKSCASMLALNRNTPPHFSFANRREAVNLDTLSATAQQYRSRAFNAVWQHDYQQATVWLEKLADCDPKEHGFVGEMYLSKLYDYSRALRHLDAFDVLTAHFDDMVGNNPVSYLRGLTYRNLGDHVKAIGQFCVGIDSLAMKHGAKWVNYRHFVSRAVSYIAMQQPEKALADLDNAARNFNRSALVAYHRGRALRQLNRTAEARTAFQDASFFFKALRAERSSSQEDEANPVYEAEIDEELAILKPKP